MNLVYIKNHVIPWGDRKNSTDSACKGLMFCTWKTACDETVSYWIISKHKPNPFPPPWIPRGSSQHRRCLLGKYSASLFLVCNSACMHARSLIWGVHVILSTPIDISGSLKEGPFVTQVVNILLKMLSWTVLYCLLPTSWRLLPGNLLPPIIFHLYIPQEFLNGKNTKN